MGKVRYSASAETDLLEAWLYVAEDSIEAADRITDQLDAEAHTLLMQPKMGRARDELAAGLRSWPGATAPKPRQKTVPMATASFKG